MGFAPEIGQGPRGQGSAKPTAKRREASLRLGGTGRKRGPPDASEASREAPRRGLIGAKRHAPEAQEGRAAGSLLSPCALHPGNHVPWFPVPSTGRPLVTRVTLSRTRLPRYNRPEARTGKLTGQGSRSRVPQELRGSTRSATLFKPRLTGCPDDYLGYVGASYQAPGKSTRGTHF